VEAVLALGHVRRETAAKETIREPRDFPLERPPEAAFEASTQAKLPRYRKAVNEKNGEEKGEHRDEEAGAREKGPEKEALEDDGSRGGERCPD
jgi:hypothetical protein